MFAGEGVTMNNLPSLLRSRDNIMYVCYCNNIRHKQLASMMPGYAATASIAYFEDLVSKLKKAFSRNGFSYVEILTPNPSWGYEPSNTVEIAKLATECLLWPVYEVENNYVTITKRPDREEQVSRLFSALKINISASEIQTLQEEVNRTWKSIQKS